MYRKHKTFYDDFFKTMYDFFLAGVKSIQKRQTHPNSGCLQAWTADRSHRLQRMVISYLNSWSIPLSTWKSGRPLPEQLIDLTVPPGRVVVCYLNSWSISLSPWKSGPLLPEQLIDLASPLAEWSSVTWTADRSRCPPGRVVVCWPSLRRWCPWTTCRSGRSTSDIPAGPPGRGTTVSQPEQFMLIQPLNRAVVGFTKQRTNKTKILIFFLIFKSTRWN